MSELEFNKFIYKLTSDTYSRLIDKVGKTDYSSQGFSFMSACGIKYDLEAFGCSKNFLVEASHNDYKRYINLYFYQGKFWICDLPKFIENAELVLKSAGKIVTPECIFNMDNTDLCCPIQEFLTSSLSSVCFIIDLSINPNIPFEDVPRIPLVEFLQTFTEKSTR